MVYGSMQYGNCIFPAGVWELYLPSGSMGLWYMEVCSMGTVSSQQEYGNCIFPAGVWELYLPSGSMGIWYMEVCSMGTVSSQREYGNCIFPAGVWDYGIWKYAVWELCLPSGSMGTVSSQREYGNCIFPAGVWDYGIWKYAVWELCLLLSALFCCPGYCRRSGLHDAPSHSETDSGMRCVSVASMLAHRGPIKCLVREGDLVVSGSDDHTLKVNPIAATYPGTFTFPTFFWPGCLLSPAVRVCLCCALMVRSSWLRPVVCLWAPSCLHVFYP